MNLLRDIGRAAIALCVIALFAKAVGAFEIRTPPPGGDQKYTIDQTLSDQAQRTTIAFDALAFLSGDACSDTFLPPGKVADYAGFQYLRDNDVTGMGHNTDFVTRAADTVLLLLDEDQLAAFIALSKTEAPLTRRYAYMRFPLMSAFRSVREGTAPAGSSGLNRSAVTMYSSRLYDLDASISLGRARTYGTVIRSMNQTQRTYLASMASGGMLTWPVADASDVLKRCGQGNSVAMRTYASEMFAWLTGSVEADVYFCPERQATYFGSFYMKDAPAMGNKNYSINTSLTGDVGEALLNLLDNTQRTRISGLVDLQRADLNEIVSTRRAIATELRRALAGETIDETAVRALSSRYGELDGAISYEYAVAFADVGRSTTAEQKQKMATLRNLDNCTCSGAYLYSQPIGMPANIPAGFLLGAGVYDEAQVMVWIEGLQRQEPTPTSTELSELVLDVNGNGRKDFADVVMYFTQMASFAESGQLKSFDYNGNGRIDFADVVWLFIHI
jgi:PKD repeat protein